jgi:plasmid maintenance system antidote protein VapI
MMQNDEPFPQTQPMEICSEHHSVAEVLPDMTPGKVLRGARGLAGMTQGQLAEKVGVHKTNISEMERDKRAIGKDMARRLAQVFGLNYKVFL